jgi:hypothetical protein
MNLHAMAGGAISIVNPFVPANIRVYSGYVTSSAGVRMPSYTEISVSVQIQPLSFTHLQHVDGLNITGIKKSAYVNGIFNGVNRPRGKGGDVIIVGGETWLIVQVLEEWPDWIKFCVALQVQA